VASGQKQPVFVLGPKDETAGCQGCVATVADDGSITLLLRLPNAFPGEYTVIPGLWFAYGHDAIVAAIGRNLSAVKAEWQAISYRFLRDDKGWRVLVSVSLSEVKHSSDKKLGVIGVDVSERLPSQLQVILPLPVRNRGRHVWSRWAVVCRKAKFALSVNCL